MGMFLPFAQLTAPGVSAAIGCGDFKEHVLQYTVAGITTNVVLRAEGSIDGENFYNLSESDTDTTVTADGTNAFTYTSKINYIRLRFVSESGGTDATVNARYTGR